MISGTNPSETARNVSLPPSIPKCTTRFSALILKRARIFLHYLFARPVGNLSESRRGGKKLKEEFPDRKFTVFNTKEISLGAGLQVKYAAELWRTGASDGELFKFLNEFTNRVATYFACDDLMYLHKGGRLSLTSGIFGTILGIKPVLTFNEEGGLSVVYKVRGRKRTIRNLARRVVEDGVELDKYEVYVVDADCGEDGDLLARLIKEGRPEAEVKRQIVGPVIASHCGPGTLGVIFVAKERPIKLSVPEQEFNS